MSDGGNLIYVYDGSFEGLLCCVFESFSAREVPAEISAGAPEQLSFYDLKEIETDSEKARRVAVSIPKKISAEAFDFIKKAYLSCLEQKEILILKFICKGYRYGGVILDMLADDTVNALFSAVRAINNEAHLLLGFTRFSDCGNALTAVISPKNTVLPLMAGHFTDRFRNENFLIYDNVHRMALMYYNRDAQILEDVDFELPEASESEIYYRNLWQVFYNTIAIKERYNPKCRMTHCPQRYWENMTELAGEIGKSQKRSEVTIEEQVSQFLPQKNAGITESYARLE